MKKLSMTFVGKLELANYGVFLDGKNIVDAIAENMLDNGKNESSCARLNLTIEPIEDAGLKVEVE